MSSIGGVIDAMIGYFSGDVRRVNHFLKVYGFAKAIGEKERLSADEQKTLEIAALTHDIGIKNSEAKYHSSAGHYQETEGPPEAEIMLKALGFDAALIERVCWLIAHHHTFDNIYGSDHAILVEADFLVNAYEDNMSAFSIRSVREKMFRTETGKFYLDTLFSGK